MSSFYFKIYNGLLEPKHVESMGEAVWIYMWLQEKCTSVNENGEGKTLGGRPVIYEKDVLPALGIARATYKRWLSRLRDGGYITTLRTPAGLVIVVTKAKKFLPSDGSKTTITDNDEKVMAQKRTSDGSNSYHDGSKVTIQYNNKQSKYNNKQTTTNVVGPTAPVIYGKPEINELFEYWSKEVGYDIESRKTDNRRAASNLLKKYGKDRLTQLIRGVALTKSDPYAPQIADFTELQSKTNKLIAWGQKKTIVGQEESTAWKPRSKVK